MVLSEDWIDVDEEAKEEEEEVFVSPEEMGFSDALNDRYENPYHLLSEAHFSYFRGYIKGVLHVEHNSEQGE